MKYRMSNKFAIYSLRLKCVSGDKNLGTLRIGSLANRRDNRGLRWAKINREKNQIQR